MEESPNRVTAFAVAHASGNRPRYQNQVDVIDKLVAVPTIDFTQIAFHAIARYRIPNLARYGASKLPSLAFPPDRVANESRSHSFLTKLVDVLEFAFSSETFSSRELVLARHNRLMTSRLCGKSFPASSPSAPNHISAADRRHPHTKSVITLSLDIRGLERPLHCTLLT